MKENVNEIDFNTYLKIYDNFEFAINENEFLFYENQIQEEGVFKENQRFDLNLMTLTSKYFKKGTFIWICKKVQELIFPYFFTAYNSFNTLFGKNTSPLNVFFNNVIELFEKKVKSIKLDNIDPIFFKEGLISFYYPFCEVLEKINDELITKQELTEKISVNNSVLVNYYIKSYYKKFVTKVSNLFASSFKEKFNREIFQNDINTIYSKILVLVIENIAVFKVSINQLNNIVVRFPNPTQLLERRS